MAEPIDLVTGAAGFSGSHLLRELLAAGRSVLATDRRAMIEDAETRRVLRACGLDLDHPNLRWLPADLLQPRTLAALFDHPVTRVFHTASLYDYSAPLERLRRVNVQGARNLLEAAADAQLERFVHWSTCGVYGKPHTAAQRGSRSNLPFTERSSSPKTMPLDATGPEGTELVNAYSVSKWEQEQLLWRARRERGLPLTIIRPAPIYGPGSSYGHGGLALGIACGMLPVLPVDAQNYITTSVHVHDLARFAVHIAQLPGSIGEDYNVVDDSIISYYDFLRYIALLTGARVRDLPLVDLKRAQRLLEATARGWRWAETRLGMRRLRVFEIQSTSYIASSYWISNRKSKATGFRYDYADVREGLKDTIDWFRELGWLGDRSLLYAASPEGSKPGTAR